MHCSLNNVYRPTRTRTQYTRREMGNNSSRAAARSPAMPEARAVPLTRVALGSQPILMEQKIAEQENQIRIKRQN